MVVVVVIGFVFFNVPIQILLLISSAYAALIAHRGIKMEGFRRGDYSSIEHGDASYLYYFSCWNHCRKLDVFWNSSSVNLLWT